MCISINDNVDARTVHLISVKPLRAVVFLWWQKDIFFGEIFELGIFFSLINKLKAFAQTWLRFFKRWDSHPVLF